MESRVKPRPWPEPPPPKQPEPAPPPPQPRRIPVVYYLSKNHHLEHPHFIEVPVSSPEGLYLRDVINRLVVLRGRRMPAMYSWSCKRSYKNGFVWHDLSENDLILPANGSEYVLKGSELWDQTPTDRTQSNLSQQEPSPSSSPPPVSVKRAKWPLPPPLPSSQEYRMSHNPCRAGSSGNESPEPMASPSPAWEIGSPSLVDYRVRRPSSAIDASTQTDDNGGRRKHERGRSNRTRGVESSEISEVELDEGRMKQSRRSMDVLGIGRNTISPPPVTSSPSSSCGKTDTLESLIRADARRVSNFRILEEEEVFVPTRAKLSATNVLMQLITCGATSVKDHRSFGLIPTYKPSFSDMNFAFPMSSGSMVLGEVDGPSEDLRFMGLRINERINEKDYFSGSSVEMAKHKEEAGGAPTLQRSSSCCDDRSCKSPGTEGDEEKVVELDSPLSKCLPGAFRVTTPKPSRNETLMSPVLDSLKNSSVSPVCGHSRSLVSSNGGSNRINDSSSVKGSSIRLESFKEEQDKMIKIEERLTSGARVIIQSRVPFSDSDDSASSQ